MDDEPTRKTEPNAIAPRKRYTCPVCGFVYSHGSCARCLNRQWEQQQHYSDFWLLYALLLDTLNKPTLH